MDRDELRRLLAEATPGKWVAWGQHGAVDVGHCTCGIGGMEEYGHESGCGLDGPLFDASEPDAALIAAAVNALPGLLDAADEADRLRDEKWWADCIRRRDGDCICNTGPGTDGPAEFCPWHGRGYAEWIDRADRLQARLTALEELHAPFGIYDECGHDHREGDPGVKNIEEVGLVCEDGLMYRVCRSCCVDDDRYQREECATYHDHDKAGTLLCPTRALLDAHAPEDGAS